MFGFFLIMLLFSANILNVSCLMRNYFSFLGLSFGQLSQLSILVVCEIRAFFRESRQRPDARWRNGV